MEITNLQAFSSSVNFDNSYISYQLYIEVPISLTAKIGKLGYRSFPKGTYVYTGSAKRNIRARILRHLSKRKKRHWHIDYLLSSPGVTVSEVVVSRLEECELNGLIAGDIVVRRFGATDCRHGCVSHLKFLTDTKRTNRQTQSNVKPVRQL